MATAPKSGNRTAAYSPLFVQKNPRAHQLPALDIPSSSLTEGTDIPPPEKEEEEPVVTSANGQGPHTVEPAGSTNGHSNGNGNDARRRGSPSTSIPLESPNPLRSHPTSTLSLSRQFQQDGREPASASSPVPGDGIGVTHTTTVITTAYHNSHNNGHPGPVSGNNHITSAAHAKRPAGPGSDTSSSPTGGASSSIKRQPSSSDTMSPPPSKRPMSVRKFLGLRALSAAFGGRSSSERGREEDSSKDGIYSHQRNRSTDLLSVFSRRPESRQSVSQPTSLKKRRSSLMLLGKRGSSFLGLNVDDESDDESKGQQPQQQNTQYHGQQQQGTVRRNGQAISAPVQHAPQESQDVQMEDVRPSTPPPSLPGLDNLKASRGLHDADSGAFMNGEDMFRNIR